MVKKLFPSLLGMILVVTFMAISANAGGVKTYQVTGPILELTDTKIVVEKGKEKWEVARDANTKVKGDLKVGAKVTIEYSMSAETITVKGK